jgi:hypothetical protein
MAIDPRADSNTIVKITFSSKKKSRKIPAALTLRNDWHFHIASRADQFQ